MFKVSHTRERSREKIEEKFQEYHNVLYDDAKGPNGDSGTARLAPVGEDHQPGDVLLNQEQLILRPTPAPIHRKLVQSTSGTDAQAGSMTSRTLNHARTEVPSAVELQHITAAVPPPPPPQQHSSSTQSSQPRSQRRGTTADAGGEASSSSPAHAAAGSSPAQYGVVTVPSLLITQGYALPASVLASLPRSSSLPSGQQPPGQQRRRPSSAHGEAAAGAAPRAMSVTSMRLASKGVGGYLPTSLLAGTPSSASMASVHSASVPTLLAPPPAAKPAAAANADARALAKLSRKLVRLRSQHGAVPSLLLLLFPTSFTLQAACMALETEPHKLLDCLRSMQNKGLLRQVAGHQTTTWVVVEPDSLPRAHLASESLVAARLPLCRVKYVGYYLELLHQAHTLYFTEKQPSVGYSMVKRSAHNLNAMFTLLGDPSLAVPRDLISRALDLLSSAATFALLQAAGTHLRWEAIEASARREGRDVALQVVVHTPVLGGSRGVRPAGADLCHELGLVVARDIQSGRLLSHYEAGSSKDISTAAAVFTLAMAVLGRSGLERLQEVEALCERAQQGLEEVVGRHHFRIAEVLALKASVTAAHGHPRYAAVAARKALAMDEYIFGRPHPRAVADRAVLADVLLACGDANMALRLQTDVLNHRVASYSPRHPEVAIALGRLAISLLCCDRLEEAVAAQHSALSILQETLDDAHPLVASGLLTLCTIYTAQHRLQEAKQAVLHALDMDTELLGVDHPRVDVSVALLADVLRQLDQLPQLASYQVSALHRSLERSGSTHDIAGSGSGRAPSGSTTGAPPDPKQRRMMGYRAAFYATAS